MGDGQVRRFCRCWRILAILENSRAFGPGGTKIAATCPSTQDRTNFKMFPDFRRTFLGAQNRSNFKGSHDSRRFGSLSAFLAILADFGDFGDFGGFGDSFRFGSLSGILGLG